VHALKGENMANNGGKQYDASRLLTYTGWSREGLTNAEIAKRIGISIRTLYVWKQKYPEFAEALREGKEDVDFRVENALFDKAIAGDTTAMIFWLKNRQPAKYRDKHEIESSGNIVVKIGFEDDGE
jgi:hypothetical protein